MKHIFTFNMTTVESLYNNQISYKKKKKGKLTKNLTKAQGKWDGFWFDHRLWEVTHWLFKAELIEMQMGGFL